MPALQSITDSDLTSAIEQARERVVLIAPGVTKSLAEAVAAAWSRLGSDRVTVILDVDPEICRFGYGTIEGLEVLQNAANAAGEALGHEPGVRICVVIADEETFVFSPTPRQLEAAPSEAGTTGTTQPKKNGIVLSKPPATLEAEVGAGPERDAKRSVGMENVDPATVDKVRKDLKSNPPKSFDLSRAVNVYNSKLHFVELKVTGCMLSQHKARLPQHLLHIVKRNKQLADKIENSIRLLESKDALITEGDVSQDAIFKLRSEIEAKYLHHVPGGTIMLREKRDELETAIRDLKAKVSHFSARVRADLDDRFRTTAEALSTEFLPDVMDDIPLPWRRFVGQNPDPEHVRTRILEALMRAFGDPEKKISKMQVELVFKDVTYEMLKDPKFTSFVAKHFAGLPFVEEHAAAKERKPNSDPDFFKS
jgi:hypothetical protein